jgi:hypothetical protein
MTSSASASGNIVSMVKVETRDCIDEAIDLTVDHVPRERRRRERGAVFE